MNETKKNTGRKFDEEFKREAAALASQPGRTDEAVARDLGVSAWSISRWRRQFGGAAKAAGGLAAEPERENRELRREVGELRQQREILKKALAIFSAAPR